MQQDRKKTREDTWKSDELKKHLKASQADKQHGDKKYKERRHVDDEEKYERTEQRHIHSDKEKKEEKELHKSRVKSEDPYMEGIKDHYRERDKVKDKERDRTKDREKYPSSEKHRTSERDKVRDRKSKEEGQHKSSTEYGGADEKVLRKREMRERLEKNKERSADQERRSHEKREKEGRRRENENSGEQERKHRKHKDDLGAIDVEKDTKNYQENSEMAMRHQIRQDKEYRKLKLLKEESIESMHALERMKRKSHSERRHDEDREKRHREKRERKTPPSERRRESEENRNQQKSSQKSIQKQEASDQKELATKENADQADSTDATYDDSTNYEEDFEDYDDDFEDSSGSDDDNDDGDENKNEEKQGDEIKETIKKEDWKPVYRNAEIEEIQKAMALENEQIASYPSVHGHTIKEQESKKELRDSANKVSPRGAFIDFGSSQKLQKNRIIANRQKKRSAELLRLIDLDFSTTFSLFDLPPVKEYEMYIRNFGKTNTKQAYIQCNDDCVDREVQTEEIDIEEKWTQHPGESAVVCGGQKTDSSLNVTAVTKVDSQRLASFLQSACQVVAVLLEEERADRQLHWKVQSQTPCMSISDGCFYLNTNLPFLHDREVYQLHFSPVQRHILLTVHGWSSSSGDVCLSNKYIICVWNIWEPSTPQKVLICESEIKCCCFSPGKASLVFAGTMDGSVLVWDLREEYSMHLTIQIYDTNWTFRAATFSTDGIFTNTSHTSPVMAIEPVPSTVSKDRDMSALSSYEEISGLSFQIASLDESGNLILWVVVELRKVDLAGSPSDLGLIPGGKVKLVHSSIVHLNGTSFPKDVNLFGSPQTLNIKFMPLDSNHFIAGTDIGVITHGTRHGLIQLPKLYKPLYSKIRPASITAIDFSPFNIPAFLAGCSDGCIRLHAINADLPAMQWNDSTDGQSVTELQWSLTRPTVFFVLDAACCIYIWDLLQNDLKPVAKESTLTDKIWSMAVVGEPEKNNDLMGLALAKTSGKVEIQYITKKWAKPQPEEMGKLRMILQEIL